MTESNVTGENNPYAPPRAPVGVVPSWRVKPRTVAWSVAALWVAFGITFTHAVIVIGYRWLSWRILGYPNDLVAGLLLCPISAQCVKCDRLIPLFDAREDGYDGAYGQACDSGRGGGELRQYECPQCAGVTFEAYPTFSYQMYEPDITPQEWTHIQDFFDWFVLAVRCDRCGKFSDAVDYECT